MMTPFKLAFRQDGHAESSVVLPTDIVEMIWDMEILPNVSGITSWARCC